MADRPRTNRYGDAKRGNLLGMAVHRAVFVPAATLILSLVIFGAVAPGQLQTAAEAVQQKIANNLGWFYLVAMNVFLGFALYLIFSRFGEIRLGGKDARPEFSNWGWYSMLFAAGTGVGLLFYGVAEPLAFYAAPPFGTERTAEAARDALVHSYFHWGLHGWSMYALMGLALAFFSYNRSLPLTVRSAFEPLLGERVRGGIGNLIDVVAAAGTLVGVAVSLGLGVKQVNSGLQYTFGVPSNMGVQLALIAGITAVATVSVVTGLSAGIQKLSKLAIVIGAVLSAYVLLIAGPTQQLLHAMVEGVGTYLSELPTRSTYAEAFKQTEGGGSWQNRWTLFYFAWWISWSPFVGMFIARISRGRTVREYMLGVLLGPTAVSILWLTVMGGSALHHELYGTGGLVEAVQADVARGSFALLESFEVPRWLGLISMMLLIIAVAIFFVTSSDSGSLVIDIITSGGDPNPQTVTRIFWATLEGVVAAILLIAGGLKALQAVATIAGLPFVVIILVMCGSLYLGLCRYLD